MLQYGNQKPAWFDHIRSTIAPFKTTIPASIRDQLIMLQYERTQRLSPILFIVIIANSIAMALAVRGELPFLQQFLPPFILIITCALCLFSWWQRRPPENAQSAQQLLQNAVLLATGLGLVSGIWCTSAFRETDQYRCVVAPVFIALSALVSANCLYSVPKAAIVSMVSALLPIVIVMLLFDDLGIRAMAVMLVIICALQIGVIRGKFDETIRMLLLQNEIAVTADTDVLTGLHNRRAFAREVEAELERGQNIIVAMFDLNGFKPVNDRLGHHAGDEVLIEVASRMRTVCISASSIARIGGDEFAMLFDSNVSFEQAQQQTEAVRSVVGLPFSVAETMVLISTSVGLAQSVNGNGSLSALLQSADIALYADKAKTSSVTNRYRLAEA